MRNLRQLCGGYCCLLLLVVLGSCASTGKDAQSDRAQVAAAVRTLLTAYAANDQEAVIRLIDTREFSFYGSDVSEIVHSSDQLRQLMTEDFKLWGSAKFGQISDMDIRVGRDLATAFFNVPFSAGGASLVTVRVSTVWRKVGGVWLLTQSANSVPTVGSSTRELLKR